MTKKIFHSILLVAGTVLLASLLVIMGCLYEYFGSVEKKQLRDELELAAVAVKENGTEYLSQLSSERYRLTWIENDGTVLYDTVTDAESLENHADRVEVKQALEYGEGESTRYSSTLLQKTMYCAERLADGSVLRISMSRATAGVLLVGMGQPILAVLIVALILSSVLAKSLSHRIVQPLNKLDLEHPLENDAYEELAPLLGRINRQHLQIDEQMDELQRQQTEFSQITSSMREGLVLLDEKEHVLSINPAAEKLFGTDESCVGQDFLTIDRSHDMSLAIERAMDEGHSEARVERGGRIWQFDVSRIGASGAAVGAVLLAFDITERETAEQTRREFTANVSHELKTPLQGIIGSAELLVNGTSYGTLKQADLQQETVFVWSQVALRQGSNTVVMRGTRNGKTFEDTVVWMHVDADSTQITSSILSVDEAAHTIALMQPVAVSDISSVLTGAAGIRLRVLQADDSTVVNDGFVQPGMQLEVTSDNGSKTARYTFVWGNLSTGKPTTASSVYAKENSQASFATDGQSDTRWTADIHGSSAVYPEWLMVDLEQTYTLSRIETDWFTGTGTRCYTYRIEASVDGQHFEEIVDRTNNTTAGKVTDALSPIQGRYVRITVTGNSDLAAKPTAVASLFELRVYGWAVRSDTYVVDDAAHTITLSPGTGTIPAAQLWQHLVLEGQVTASVSDDTLTSGDTLVLTDAFGVSTTYALILPLQGDVDDNGQVDVIDALMVLQHSAQVIHLTNDQLSRADIDRDAAHQVTAADALMILQYATGNREVLE